MVGAIWQFSLHCTSRASTTLLHSVLLLFSLQFLIFLYVSPCHLFFHTECPVLLLCELTMLLLG